jgi:nardilysin
MGSTKYPAENEYDSFVSSHGGSCNAFTQGQSTTYQFDVSTEYFPRALDIFANCFCSPLLSADSVERELKSIDSEFNLAKNSDSNRLEQIQCAAVVEGHPVKKFGWGNLESLKVKPEKVGLDVLALMSDFFEKYYRPQSMKLVVISPEPIEAINSYVKTSFSCIVAKANLPTSTSLPPIYPFPDASLRVLSRVVPVARSHKLKLSWQMPSTTQEYRSKTSVYIAHIVGHEGPNSLLSTLKAKKFVSAITSGVGGSDLDSNTLSSLFTISLTLTDIGFANWILVVDIVFSYLEMLRRNEPVEWVFDELKSISQLEYRFLEEEENESDFVENMSINMASFYKISREDLLSCETLFWDWNPDIISERLSLMTPRNARINLLSPYFGIENDEEEVDEDDGDNDDDIEDGDDDDDDDDEDMDEDEDENDEDEELNDQVEQQNLLSLEELVVLYSGPDIPSFRKICVDFSFCTDEVPLKEAYFGTRYWQTIIPEEIYAFWQEDIGSKHHFCMIAPNHYIPQRLELEESASSTMKFPVLISDVFDGGLKAWHYLDLSYSVKLYLLF